MRPWSILKTRGFLTDHTAQWVRGESRVWSVGRGVVCAPISEVHLHAGDSPLGAGPSDSPLHLSYRQTRWWRGQRWAQGLASEDSLLGWGHHNPTPPGWPWSQVSNCACVLRPECRGLRLPDAPDCLRSPGTEGHACEGTVTFQGTRRADSHRRKNGQSPGPLMELLEAATAPG